MVEVIGISFNESNKVYYFLPNELILNKGTNVLVETERGEQYGTVVTDLINVDPKKLTLALKPILRIATDEETIKYESNLTYALKALEDAKALAIEMKLEMKILTASFTFDRKQLMFNFLADDRVDFRNLAKKLAGIYKTRIELRQIGVRDKAKEVGGHGQCGRSLCCSTFLKDLNSVSINMAKNQSLSLTPQKINGVCGRLMCCLSYENDSYSEYKKNLPKMGETVKIKEGTGRVTDIDLFNQKYKVELTDGKTIEIEK